MDVSKGVRARMAELAETFPAGVKYNVTLDTTDVVHDSIDEVMKTFVEAIVLVVLVIFFSCKAGGQFLFHVLLSLFLLSEHWR